MGKNKKIIKDIKNDLRCDLIYYSGYRDCVLKVMNKVMQFDKKNKSKKKKSNKLKD